MYFFCIVYQIVLIIDNKSASFVGSSVDEFIIKDNQSIEFSLPYFYRDKKEEPDLELLLQSNSSC